MAIIMLIVISVVTRYHYALKELRKGVGRDWECITLNIGFTMFDVDDDDIIWAIVILGSVMFAIMNPFR